MSRYSVQGDVGSLSARCWRQTGSLHHDTLRAGRQGGVVLHAVLLARLLHLASSVSSAANDGPEVGAAEVSGISAVSLTDTSPQQTVTSLPTCRATGGQGGHGGVGVCLAPGSLVPLHTHLSFHQAGPVRGHITLTRK